MSLIVERDEYLQLLDRADVVSLPTTLESYGMRLVEAACRGLAMV